MNRILSMLHVMPATLDPQNGKHRGPDSQVAHDAVPSQPAKVGMTWYLENGVLRCRWSHQQAAIRRWPDQATRWPA
jgi:hypothetical protein